MFPIAYHPIYKYPVPEGHRFPMDKYELLPIQLLREGIAEESDFFSPEPVDLGAVYAVHSREYIDRLVGGGLTRQEMRRIGFTYSSELIERELRITRGTVDGALKALDAGIAFNIAGGTHHAARAVGEGFCMINDQAVAAQFLVDQALVKKVLVVDLDVHQGNGTADIFINEDRIFTFSMHAGSNYPFRKTKSDLDVELPDRIGDDAYLSLLSEHLPRLIKTVKPEFIFFQAGVDILASDKLGRLSCSMAGCRQRDELLFAAARKHGIPVQCSMGGGYSPQLKTILDAHTNTYRSARRIWS